MEGTSLTRLQKKRLLRASVKLKKNLQTKSEPSGSERSSPQSVGDCITRGPTENNRAGSTILSPAANTTRTLLAPVRTNSTRRERHIQLLMAQTGADHDIAARCLDSADGDIAGAIMKIFDTSRSSDPSPVLLAPIQKRRDNATEPFLHTPKLASPFGYTTGATVHSVRGGRYGFQGNSSWENAGANFLSLTEIGAANTVAHVHETGNVQRLVNVW